MSGRLPALRGNLDAMPSPVPDRPGLLLRDPLGYSEQVLIVPPGLTPALACFDGESTLLDLRERLVRLTGALEVEPLIEHLLDALGGAGFLDDDTYARLKAGREAGFAAAAERPAAHAGSAYPAEPEALRNRLTEWLGGERRRSEPGATAAVRSASAAQPLGSGTRGIAAPHVSPDGGVSSYRAAYSALPAGRDGRTAVILGTSHYGEPETFGVTGKPFRTPLGTIGVDGPRMERLASAGPAVRREDYCHAVEHSIEFQVVFLQHLQDTVGVTRILPVLVGPFARRTSGPGLPEDDPDVARVLDALASLADEGGDELVWVLGVDLAHVGRRYGDAFEARVGDSRLQGVESRDRERLAALAAGDATGFWSLVQRAGDDLRWCGASPLYAFARATGARGQLLHYEQWNIDSQSVVSFAGMSFAG